MMWLLLGVLFLVSWLSVGVLKGWLIKKQLVDIPEERKNHDRIVPRGAGLVLVPLIMGGWVTVDILAGQSLNVSLYIATLMLLALGFRDDRHGASAKVKLLVQMVAVAIAMPPLGVFEHLPWLPTYAWWGVMLLAWVWWVNLFNFMDGMDGISAWQVIAVCAMIVLLGLGDVLPEWVMLYAAVMMVVMLGFYRWNHHPAHIFLGDAGSLPIGLMLGYMLMLLVVKGYWWLALLLPAYYWADATITLIKRFFQGKNIAQAHSEHWYQRALRAGLGHKKVLAHILILYAIKLMVVSGWIGGVYGSDVMVGLIIISVVALLAYWSYIIQRYEQPN